MQIEQGRVNEPCISGRPTLKRTKEQEPQVGDNNL